MEYEDWQRVFFFLFSFFHMVGKGRIGRSHKDYRDGSHSTVQGVLIVRLSLSRRGGPRSFPDRVFFYPHLRRRR